MGKILQAQRVAYELNTGIELTSNVLIMQTCENKLCCNPAHLYDNTLKKLRQTMSAQGRIPGFEQGEENRAAKLNAKEVLEIKGRYVRGKLGSKRLAKQYGISRSEIRNIVHGRKWGWLKMRMSPFINMFNKLISLLQRLIRGLTNRK